MNIGERKLCEFKNGLSGSFYQSLFETIFKADPNNRDRLLKGFPEEVEAVIRYGNENDYWSNLEKEFQKSLYGSTSKNGEPGTWKRLR